MFYHIEGTVSQLGGGVAVIDCGGVGFELNVSLNTLSRLKPGEKAKLLVCESVKEDAFDLYGFAEPGEKRFFQLLMSLWAIGPKAAWSILSASTPEQLAVAIMAGDEKALTVAPGIGKKIAQRVIYELRDKISKEAGSLSVPLQRGAGAAPSGTGKLSDAAAALAVLGYSTAEVNAALRGVDGAALDTEGIIKAALKNMMK